MKLFLACLLALAPGAWAGGSPSPSPESLTHGAASKLSPEAESFPSSIDPEDRAAWENSNRRFRASFLFSAYLLADAQGREGAAISFLQSASDSDPSSSYLLKELASQYEARDMSENAIAAYLKVLGLNSDDKEAKAELARLYVHDGDDERARSLFLNPDGSMPQSREGLKALAALDIAQEKWAPAADELGRLTTLYPEAIEEREMYAEVLLKAKRRDEAVSALKAVLQKDPSRSEAAYELSQIAQEDGKADQAIAILKDAIAKSQDKATLEEALARLYYKGGKFKEALKYFDAILLTNPKDPESLLFRAMARLQTKDFAGAEGDFKDLGQVDDSNPSQLYGLGLAQIGQGKLDDAKQSFQSLVQKHPKVVAGYSELASIEEQTSRTSEALETLKSGIKENPAAAQLYLLLGSAEEDAGQNRKAEEVFQQGVQASGNSSELRFQLAVLFDKEGRFPEAEKELNEIIDVEPSNAEALNYLGYSWVDRGTKLGQAEALIRRALAVEPENHYYQDSLGWACYKLGKYDEAKTELEKAVSGVEAGPEQWIVFEHLGEVYKKLGDNKSADENFEKAKELKPKTADDEKN